MKGEYAYFMQALETALDSVELGQNLCSQFSTRLAFVLDSPFEVLTFFMNEAGSGSLYTVAYDAAARIASPGRNAGRASRSLLLHLAHKERKTENIETLSDVSADLASRVRARSPTCS